MRVVKEKKSMYQVVAFCLFMMILPINLDFLGGNGNTLKLQMKSK
jgi:hypothetical protein